MEKNCAICGSLLYSNTPFKSSYICEECVHFVKTQKKFQR